MSNPAIVHVYGQETQHDGVYIVGNRDGLLRLKAAIEEALLHDQQGTKVYANDGEGFIIHTILLDQPWRAEAWTRMSVPYTDRIVMEARENAIWPWHLLKGDA